MQICYGLAMQNTPGSGYVVNINGAFRTSRDLEASAYDAANRLKKKNPARDRHDHQAGWNRGQGSGGWPDGLGLRVGQKAKRAEPLLH